MSTITAKDLNIHYILNINENYYDILMISSKSVFCNNYSNQQNFIVIKAVNKELDNTIELVYPENYCLEINENIVRIN
jgi:hypothetical protein